MKVMKPKNRPGPLANGRTAKSQTRRDRRIPKLSTAFHAAVFVLPRPKKLDDFGLEEDASSEWLAKLDRDLDLVATTYNVRIVRPVNIEEEKAKNALERTLQAHRKYARMLIRERKAFLLKGIPRHPRRWRKEAWSHAQEDIQITRFATLVEIREILALLELEEEWDEAIQYGLIE